MMLGGFVGYGVLAALRRSRKASFLDRAISPKVDRERPPSAGCGTSATRDSDNSRGPHHNGAALFHELRRWGEDRGQAALLPAAFEDYVTGRFG